MSLAGLHDARIGAGIHHAKSLTAGTPAPVGIVRDHSSKAGAAAPRPMPAVDPPRRTTTFTNPGDYGQRHEKATTSRGGSTVKTQATDITAAIDAAIAEHRHAPESVLPVLHAIQDRIGHIPAAAVPAIATALNLSRAEIHGVISYYAHFRTRPCGRHRIELCRAEACQARDSAALIAHAQQRLGCGFHETTPDGHISLEPVFCLGLCATGPALMIDGEVHARVTPDRFDALIASLGDEG